ncbi:CHAT domain-containing protein [Nonomuraea polychroma]|uniref:CHAT domain-containing protein n=1 Tax=Nonomuraea polychroma TaxID=46176 RepID=UPI000FDD6780|nr:CHAT domain-containing protein [Nonomuraea polychroma]
MTSGSVGVAELLPLVFARPREALDRARALLAAEPGPYDASIAHQVIGIWERDFGELARGLSHLRRARALAARSRSADREADVLAALGVAYVHAGRTRESLDALSRGVQLASGESLARVLFRRAYAMWVLGRYGEALADVRRALPILRRAGDVIWTARALTLRGTLCLAMGSAERAKSDFAAAERLWETTGQEHDKAIAVENRGLAAFRSGDLPAALYHLAAAERRFAELGTPAYVLSIERCAVLLAAGLARDAVRETDAAIARLDRLGGARSRRAELLLAAARAAAACGDLETAIARAGAAYRSFTRQGREWWSAQARSVLLQTRFARGEVSGRWAREAGALATRLAELGSPDAAQAHLLAGRIAMALGRTGEARVQLAAAAQGRFRGPAFARVDGWLAQALLAETAGNGKEVFAACHRGLDLLDEHRMTLGASELRARAAGQGAELVTLAQRVIRREGGGPRRLLEWSERWRAHALAVPSPRPPADPELLRDLTAFREISSRLEAARSAGGPVQTLRREQARLEREIRAHTLAANGSSGVAGPRFDVRELLGRLGDGWLVELVSVDGELRVLVCGRGRVREYGAGRLAEAALEADHACAELRRLAYGGDVGLGLLEECGRRLEEVLFGGAVLGEGPVVVVPPGRLHGVPWALLPSLRDRAVSVSPSAQVWLRAGRLRPLEDRVVLVRGAGLGAEVPSLAAAYGSATVLERGEAAAQRVLKEIDGCRVAHIAAHGAFRADSPMFSSLRLDDGPLTVHDLERLRRAPHQIILSACDAGRLEPVGGDELLGLAAALLPLGTAGIVASCVPVNDDAVVPLMIALHDGLRRGLGPAAALRDARAAMPPDPLHQATGWSFSAIGA